MIPLTTQWIARPKFTQKAPNWLLKTNVPDNVMWDVPMRSQFGQPENIFQVFAFEADNTVFPKVKVKNVHRDVFVVSASEDCKFHCTINEHKLDLVNKLVVETDQEQEIAIPLQAGQGFSYDPSKLHYLVGTALFVVVDRDKSMPIEISVPTAMEQTYINRDDELSEMERDILRKEQLERDQAIDAEYFDNFDIKLDVFDDPLR